MRKFFILKKEKTVLPILIFLLAFLLFSEYKLCTKINISGKKNKERLKFINSLKIEVINGYKKKEIKLPYCDTALFKEYNSLQNKAGFDLLPYLGEKITLFTYQSVADKDLKINLLVYKGEIIGGNINKDGQKPTPLLKEK